MAATTSLVMVVPSSAARIRSWRCSPAGIWQWSCSRSSADACSTKASDRPPRRLPGLLCRVMEQPLNLVFEGQYLPAGSSVPPVQHRLPLDDHPGIGHPLGGAGFQDRQPVLLQCRLDLPSQEGLGRAMVITKADMGTPWEDSCLAFTASTMSEAAHTSKGLGLAGIRTRSAARTASALVRLMPAGPSMITQGYSAASRLASWSSRPGSAPRTSRFRRPWG